jgi:hypothetical protein
VAAPRRNVILDDFHDAFAQAAERAVNNHGAPAGAPGAEQRVAPEDLELDLAHALYQLAGRWAMRVDLSERAARSHNDLVTHPTHLREVR